MDRAGRLWIAVPSMVALGLTQAALPLTGGLASLTVVAMLMGFGNGIGSGVLMTLGADVAPPRTRSQFLGVWRLCADSGSAAGPLVVSAAAALLRLRHPRHAQHPGRARRRHPVTDLRVPLAAVWLAGWPEPVVT